MLYGSPDAASEFGKGAGGDTMKKIDLVAEKTVIDFFEEKKLSCTLISEETGTKKIGTHPGETYITIDPVDGTTNAVRGVPFFATSLAMSRAPYLKDVETALVSDLFHDVTYTAQKKRGAFRNGEKINPAQTGALQEAVIGIDLAFRLKKGVATPERGVAAARHLRHLGANALEICYVADGTIDAFIDLRGRTRTTDIAAAYLIITEAGGIMVTPKGEELNARLNATQRVSFIAAANKKLHEVIKKTLV
jgi:myo-inositol-1(or 4)-monophosphatase